MDPIPLPPPYGGVDQKNPIVALQSPNCENLLNFNLSNVGAVLRNGDSIAYNFALTGTDGRFALNLIPDETLNEIYTVILNGQTLEYNIYDKAGNFEYNFAVPIGIGAAAWPRTTSVYFNKSIFFFPSINTDAAHKVNNAGVFSVSGYTAATGSPTTIQLIGGAVYKNRMYAIQYLEAGYWYSGIDATSGAMTYVDLTGFTQAKVRLSSIGTFTISDQVTTEAFIAFVMSNGEILFYNGSYPNSADWRLAGKVRIPQPLFISSTILYQGDTLVMCDGGVVSLRDLFLKGSQQALSLSISDLIQTKWTALVKAIRTSQSTPTGPILSHAVFGSINGIYDPKNDRIVISFPYYLDSAGALQDGSFYFVFNAELGAWSFHRSFGGRIYDINIHNNTLYCLSRYGTNNGVTIYAKEGAADFMDDDADTVGEIAYDYEIVSAPVANGRAFVQKGEGLDVIINSDLYSETSYYLIRDFGVETTTAQTVPNVISGSLQKPFVNIGIEGSYIQWKLSGTTAASKTVGLKLYGTNFWIEQGQSPR